jgi:hypothetical protein
VNFAALSLISADAKALEFKSTPVKKGHYRPLLTFWGAAVIISLKMFVSCSYSLAS